MTKMDTSALRKEIINKRKNLDTSFRFNAQDIIVDKICALNEYKECSSVLLYADANGEVPTDKLILKALMDGKKVYCPVSLDNYVLKFYQIFALEELYPGKYGIREPLMAEYLSFLPKNNTDEKVIAIVPGVLFDKAGNRCGYGKGYYDRFFADNSIDTRIGIAYDFQVLKAIEKKETDIPMSMVITN